jgi:hypothetical protein
MLEVQDAKPLTIERHKYEGLYFKNDEFYCKIYDGRIQELIYTPKCDFETFMYTWKNKILARYLRTCIQYYAFVYPTYTTITISDELSIRGVECERYQFLYLTNLMVAFFKQTWFMRYMNAVLEDEDDVFDTTPLDTASPDFDLMMSRAWMSGYGDISAKYRKVCKESKTVFDFLKLFTKRSRFKDCISWIFGYIKNEIRPIFKNYKIPIYPLSVSETKTFESVTCTHVEHFEECPYIEGKESEIVIRNEIIYTSSFSWADVDSMGDT